MSALAHVVFATTGAYSDRCLWVVRVFTEEWQATQFALMANEWLRERGLIRERQRGTTGTLCRATGNECLAAEENPPEFDRKLRVDYTGTEYYVEAVPFGTWRAGLLIAENA